MAGPVKKTIVTDWGTFTRQSRRDYKFVVVVGGREKTAFRAWRAKLLVELRRAHARTLEGLALAGETETTYIEMVGLRQTFPVTRTRFTRAQYQEWADEEQKTIDGWEAESERVVAEEQRRTDNKQGGAWQWSSTLKSAITGARAASKTTVVAGIWDIDKGEWAAW